MVSVLKSAIVCAVILLPAASWAQQNDAAYCSALAQKYQKYAGDNEAQHRGQQRDATVDVAVTQCATKPAQAIPVLEKALTDAKVSLPPRS
jgi:hypothetical protein